MIVVLQSNRRFDHHSTPMLRWGSKCWRIGRDDTDSIIANRIGFLSQAYEATAGLIGNTLLALAAHAEARSAVIAHPGYLDNAIQETLRYDPPVQNTRRL